MENSALFRTDHDLTLPAIGPYSRRCTGALQILDRHTGQSMLYPVAVSNSSGTRSIDWQPAKDQQCNWTLLETDAEGSLFTYRYFLDETAGLFCDARFIPVDDNSFVCEVTAVNDTDIEQTISLVHGILHEWEWPGLDIRFPVDSICIEAEDYVAKHSFWRGSLDGERECVRRMLFASSDRVVLTDPRVKKGNSFCFGTVDIEDGQEIGISGI